MNTYHTATLPSLSQLGKATATAAAVAALILLVAVLPAEYGIDPTGLGKALSLTRLNGAPASGVPAAPAGPAAAVPMLHQSALPWRSDTMRVTLKPGEGAEIKASMRKGEGMVFNWVADGGAVKSDMHGEPHNAKPNEFTTYWKKPVQSEGRGAFTAPFDGIHGWFWRNKNAQAVTISVTVSGFHDKLYRPDAAQ